MALMPPPLPKHHPAEHGRYADRGAADWASRLDAAIETVNARSTRGQGQVAQTQIVEGAQPNASAGVIPFRRATTFRTARLEQTAVAALTASEQPVAIQVEGSGFMYGIDVQVTVTTAGNAAAVAYHEDAPWSALTSVVLGDVNGELVNLTGFDLRVLNLYGGWAADNPSASADTLVYQLVSGAGATGGSFRFHLFVPVALNRRTLLGLVSNQDRAQKYSLRTNVAAGGVGGIYTTAPTNPGSVSIDRIYENYAVPAPANAQGIPQETMPPKFGVLAYATKTVSPALPTSNTTQNHFLPRLGNTIRLLILIFRDGNGATARTDADANPPSLIKFTLGDTPIFAETAAYRRSEMRKRYNVDAPAGVYVYDWITDVVQRAGSEFGDDYIFTNGLSMAQFEVAYGAGWAASSSLTIITHDLVVPPGVNLYD